MAGIGRPPKPPGTKAGHSKDTVQVRTVLVTPSQQPDLPTRYRPRDDDEPWGGEIDWPTATVEWWQMWGRSPMAREFTETDWSELLITAYLHAQFMEGDYKLAGELRLRTAKFGATPEDRLRLRIQFAQAVGTEVDTAAKVVSSRDRFPGMRLTPELES